MVKINDIEINPRKNKFNLPKYKFENLVVGGSFKAILFAYENGFPIIFKKIQRIQYNEKTKRKITEENSQYQYEEISLKLLLEQLIYLLGLAGLILFEEGIISSFNIIDQNNIEVFSNSWNLKIFSNKIHIFEEKNLEENIDETQLFKIIDKFEVIHTKGHEGKNITFKNGWPIYEILYKNNNFPKQINLYRKKTACRQMDNIPNCFDAVSFLSHKQVNDDEFSSSKMKIILSSIFKQFGVKGPFLHFINKKGIRGTRFSKLKFRLIEREILGINEVNEIDFNFNSKSDILNKLYFGINYNENLCKIA